MAVLVDSRTKTLMAAVFDSESTVSVEYISTVREVETISSAVATR